MLRGGSCWSNGALVTALLEGTALPEAIRFAHAAAAIAVTRKGAQPSEAIILKFCRSPKPMLIHSWR